MSDMALKDFVKQWEERCEKATPGPWDYDEYPACHDYGEEYDQPIIHLPDGKELFAQCDVHHGEDYFERVNDLKFVAHSRQDIPTLLAIVKRQQEALEEIASMEPMYALTGKPENICESCGHEKRESLSPASDALSDCEKMVGEK